MGRTLVSLEPLQTVSYNIFHIFASASQRLQTLMPKIFHSYKGATFKFSVLYQDVNNNLGVIKKTALIDALNWFLCYKMLEMMQIQKTIFAIYWRWKLKSVIEETVRG